MDVIHFFFTRQLPKYFSNLPLPRTFGGFAELSGKEWLDLLPLFGFIVILFIMIIGQFFEGKSSAESPKPSTESSEKKDTIVNPSIDKEKEKIAQTFDIEDLGKKTVFCRCWRSKKFPYCDGTHNTHNRETGDNVGPLIIQCPGKEEEEGK